MRTSTLRILLVSAASCLALSSQAALFFDDFKIAQASSTNSGASGFDAGTTVAFGAGTRSLFTLVSSNSAPGDARARTAIPGTGYLSFSSDDEVTATAYDTYGLGVATDMTGTTGFRLDFLNNDLAGTVAVQATDSGNHVVQVGAALPVGAGSVTLSAPFAGIDATKIVKLSFLFGGSRSEDLSVGRIQAVPEPSAFAALGLGALALLRRRRA